MWYRVEVRYDLFKKDDLQETRLEMFLYHAESPEKATAMAKEEYEKHYIPYCKKILVSIDILDSYREIVSGMSLDRDYILPEKKDEVLIGADYEVLDKFAVNHKKRYLDAKAEFQAQWEMYEDPN